MGFSGFASSTAPGNLDQLVIEQGGNTRYVTVSALTEAINLRVSLSGVSDGTQTLTNNTWTQIEWKTEALDDGYTTDLSLAPGLALRVDETTAGDWFVYSSLEFAYSAANTTPRRVRILKNGTDLLSGIYQRATSASVVTDLAAQAIVKLEPHDYITVEGNQASGGNLDISGGFFYAHRMAL